MKPIELAQIGSTIALLTVAAYLMVTGTIVLFLYPDRMGGLTTLAAQLLLFVGPEKVVAFAGPVVKRWQANGKAKGK